MDICIYLHPPTWLYIFPYICFRERAQMYYHTLAYPTYLPSQASPNVFIHIYIHIFLRQGSACLLAQEKLRTLASPCVLIHIYVHVHHVVAHTGVRTLT